MKLRGVLQMLLLLAVWGASFILIELAAASAASRSSGGMPDACALRQAPCSCAFPLGARRISCNP